MKIRSGFVSNSSSSSFIIIIDESKIKKCPTCGHYDESPLNWLPNRKTYYDDTHIRWDSLDDRIEELKNSRKEYDYDYINIEISTLNKIKSRYKNKKIIGVQISNHDEDTNNRLSELERRGIIEMLPEEYDD